MAFLTKPDSFFQRQRNCLLSTPPSCFRVFVSFTGHYCTNGAMSRLQISSKHNGISQPKSRITPLHYPFWFGGSAASMAAVVTHPLDLGRSFSSPPYALYPDTLQSRSAS